METNSETEIPDSKIFDFKDSISESEPARDQAQELGLAKSVLHRERRAQGILTWVPYHDGSSLYQALAKASAK